MTLAAQPLMMSIWIAVMIAQGCVLALLLNRRGHREYPAFTAFIGFRVVFSLLLFYVANYCAAFYQVARWVLYVPQLPIMVALVWEVFHTLFYPYATLPRRTISHFLQATLAVTVIAVTFAILHPGAQPTAWMTFARATDQVLTWVLCSVFAFIAIFAKYFGIPWRHRVYGIAAGFLLYLSVDVVVETAFTQLRLPAYHAVSYLGMVAFFAACVIWARYFATAEASRSIPTLSDLRSLESVLHQFAAALKGTRWTARGNETES